MKKKLLAAVVGFLALTGLSQIQASPAGAINGCIMPTNSSCWMLAANGSIEMTMSANHMVGIKHGPANNPYAVYVWEAWLPSYCMGLIVMNGGNNAGFPATLTIHPTAGSNCVPYPHVYDTNTVIGWTNKPNSVPCGPANYSGARNFFGAYGTYVTGTWFEFGCTAGGGFSQYSFW